MISVQAGSVVRSTITFDPPSGTVALADVSCRVRSIDGTSTVAPASAVTNEFYADIEVPDTARKAVWVVRWESNAPSAKISKESSFLVEPSAFPAP